MKSAWIAILVLILTTSFAPAQLAAGDVAIVAYNSDSPDGFAWVALADIPSNTVLNFTDSSVSNGYFYWAEHLENGPQLLGKGGPLTWSHAGNLPRGSVVSFSSAVTNWSVGTVGGHYPLLSASGDQLFVYTNVIAHNPALPGGYEGEPSGAVMFFGINFGNSGWSDAGGTSWSAIPSGLSTGGLTAVSTGARDNGYYSGIRTGSLDEIRQAIANPANWTGSDGYIDPDSWPAWLEILPGTVLFEFSHRRPAVGRLGGES